mmetsp:Transcript_27607/g.82674  ORF Transcript_27607/g.82674 Transcript_27607/m.82674 type:complete len:251 (-) Transcript_27607:1208-1960(-)
MAANEAGPMPVQHKAVPTVNCSSILLTDDVSHKPAKSSSKQPWGYSPTDIKPRQCTAASFTRVEVLAPFGPVDLLKRKSFEMRLRFVKPLTEVTVETLPGATLAGPAPPVALCSEVSSSSSPPTGNGRRVVLATSPMDPHAAQTNVFSLESSSVCSARSTSCTVSGANGRHSSGCRNIVASMYPRERTAPWRCSSRAAAERRMAINLPHNALNSSPSSSAATMPIMRAARSRVCSTADDESSMSHATRST